MRRLPSGELWAVDAEIAKDMVTVFAMLPSWQNYPDSIGYGKEFGELVRLWRPELGKGSTK